jgi:hypothetical protein
VLPALMVDAKDEPAAAFYRHHGFIARPDLPLTVLLPLATVRPRRDAAAGCIGRRREAGESSSILVGCALACGTGHPLFLFYR